MKKISHLGVLSVAKFQGMMMALMGLLFSVLFLGLSSLIGGVISSFGGGNVAFPVTSAWVMIIIVPILYGIMGFVMGAIGAFIYNIVAKIVGGIEVEITD